MNYLRLDNRKRKSNNSDIAKASIVVVILIIVFYALSGPISDGLRWIQSSIAQTFGRTSTIVRDEADNALIKSLEAENTQLKELIGRKVASEPVILAAVVVHPPKSPYDTIVVDAGESQGVKKDMVVFGELQYAIGRVTDVRTNSSVITLFSSSNQKETVIIGTSTSGSSTEAIAEGRGGGNFYIKLPRNVEVAVGDPIVWPASSIVLLGAVEKVDADKGGTYAHIYFKSPINIQSLRYVQIKEQLY